jgi:hypothetical protein
MSKEYNYGYQGHQFTLTESEYNFIMAGDLWEALSEFCHQWDIDNDPGGWDLMMECFVPYMTIEEK